MIIKSFRSLNYMAKKEIENLKSKNVVYREHKYFWLRYFIVKNSTLQKSLAFSFLSFVFFVILSILAYYLRNISSDYITLYPLFPKAEDIHNILLNVQTTLVGFVYPVVIGFVSILLQWRHSAKSRLKIYLVDSAALLIGFSSIFLILMIVIHRLLMAYVPQKVSIAWILFDSFWLCLNIIGYMFFIYRTIAFIIPDIHNKIIKEYLVNIAWPDKLKVYTIDNIYNQRLDLLFSDLSKKNLQKNFTVNSGLQYFILNEEEGYKVRFDYPQTFVDLKIGKLNRLFRKCAKQQQQQTKNIFISKKKPTSNNYKFILPLIPGESCQEATLLIINPHINLTEKEQKKLRKCFVFSESTKKTWVDVDDIIEDLKEDVLREIDSWRIEGFRTTLYLIEDFHILMLKLSITEGEKGKNINLLEENNFYRWDINLCEVCENIFKRSVDLLEKEESFFQHAIYIPYHLYNEIKNIADAKIIKKLIELHSNIYFRYLRKWWTNRIEQQLGTKGLHNELSTLRLSPPLSGIYDRNFREYVGSWERMLDGFLESFKKEGVPWKNLIEKTRWLEGHLYKTSLILIWCIRNGDNFGAEWFFDVLQKWMDRLWLRFDQAYDYKFINQNYLINLQISDNNWDEIEIKFNLNSLPGYYNKEDIPSKVFYAMFENYWKDVCSIVFCIINDWAKKEGIGHAYNQSLLNRLIKGITKSDGISSLRKDKPFSSLDSVLLGIVRQNFSFGGYHRGYASRLGDLVRSLSDFGIKEIVPGRIYSGADYKDLSYCRDGHIILMMLIIEERITIENKTTEDILYLALSHYRKVDEIIDYFKNLIKRLQDIKYSEWNKIFEYFIGVKSDEALFDNRKKILEKILSDINTFVKENFDEKIKEAPLDDKRIKRYLKKVLIILREKGYVVPFSLFKEIKYSNTLESPEFEKKIQKQPKGIFTYPFMSDPSKAELNFYIKDARKLLSQNLMIEIINNSEVLQVGGESPEKYWNQFKIASSELFKRGLTPILLNANRISPKWLSEWIFHWDFKEGTKEKNSLPKDLILEKDQEEKSIIINGVPLYYAPIPESSSYIIAKEALKKISFFKYENGLPIKALLEVVASGTEIDITFKWSFKLELEKYPVTQINFMPINIE